MTIFKFGETTNEWTTIETTERGLACRFVLITAKVQHTGDFAHMHLNIFSLHLKKKLIDSF